MGWRHSSASGVRVRLSALVRSEEHTSELQSRLHLVCRLLLEKKKALRRSQIDHWHREGGGLLHHQVAWTFDRPRRGCELFGGLVQFPFCISRPEATDRSVQFG